MIHDTESCLDDASHWFENPGSNVSAHYGVGKDGKIIRYVQEEMEAWHAGVSDLWGVNNVNSYSIGIELEGYAGQAFEELQIASLIDLCEELCITYQIPLNRVVGHDTVARPIGRKTDPGAKFPWYEFLNCLGARVSAREIKE